MNDESRHIQSVYLVLLLLHTLAASFIWGINTLFLLDAGLNNAQAFAANAFFTAGLVVFEVPTGVIADIRGRRFSYLLGTLTLTISTVIYLSMWHVSAPFWAWAIASVLLGLGFTFFSGAVQAWLVDALVASGFKGQLDAVFAKGEIVEGMAMLSGSVAGGYLAQVTNLGTPYIVRAVVLAVTFVLAFILMRDVGFTPKHTGNLVLEVKNVLSGAIRTDCAIRRCDGSCWPTCLPTVCRSTSSMRCSPIYCSCTATRPRTAWRDWRRQSSAARRLAGDSLCHDLRADSGGARRCWSRVSC